MTNNLVFYEQTKHIKNDFILLGMSVMPKKICSSLTSSKKHLANIFTKPLGLTDFLTPRNKHCMIDIYFIKI